ncbi:MAG: tyrosine-protein phosphatase [Hungatella sp.]|nr:tyrosine-protein phosphatase [Hungatella sp.]
MDQYIPLEGTFNFRDMGGYYTEEGRRVKTGLVFRSDSLHKLSDGDLKRLEKMNIRTAVDFRSQAEREAQPDRLPEGVRLEVLSPDGETAALASVSHKDDEGKIARLAEWEKTSQGHDFLIKNLDSMEGQMRSFVTSENSIRAFSSFLRLLINSASSPLVFHCRGGKDRTGWAAALFLSILEVPREEIIREYLKTARYNSERNKKRMDQYRQYTDNKVVLDYISSLMETKESYIRAAFEEVDRQGGMDAYLDKAWGFYEADRTRLKEIYLE